MLDAILEVGIGISLVLASEKDKSLFFWGLGLTIFGIIQFIRKIKTFTLTPEELIIERPLFPFTKTKFQISKIKKIKFVNVTGRFGGPHLIVETSNQLASFRIGVSKENIDNFEINLKALGIESIREGL
jgi:hypothetical protein